VTVPPSSPHPSEAQPLPPYPEQTQPYPSQESEVRPRPDDGADVQQFGHSTPTGRTPQPAELAPIALLLPSAESSYVIGATGGRPLA
jgi:NAD(P)-dependent dehydrogenase (short-subunit alcohol dehydrogenase family)